MMTSKEFSRVLRGEPPMDDALESQTEPSDGEQLANALLGRDADPDAVRRFIESVTDTKPPGKSIALREDRSGPGATVELTERVSSDGASLRVDRANGVIRGVKIVGRVSSNGREYLREALHRAVGLYEQAKVNVDHAAGSSPKPARSYEDRIGHLANIQAKDDGLYGDLHYNPGHRLAEQLAWDAERAPRNVGLSHVVKARTKTQSGKVVVESIEEVVSVDLVGDPAATGGLFEGRTDDGPAIESGADFARAITA